MKKWNGYAASLPTYSDTPKSVLAAIALSLAMRLNDDNAEAAVIEIYTEWAALHRAGIVPQKPPSVERVAR